MVGSNPKLKKLPTPKRASKELENVFLLAYVVEPGWNLYMRLLKKGGSIDKMLTDWKNLLMLEKAFKIVTPNSCRESRQRWYI